MRVICGTLKAELLFYNKLTIDLKNHSFKINPYDRCISNKIVNGKQLTAVWHVDDLKASYEENSVLEKLVERLHGEHDDEKIGIIKVNWGPKHDFLGMFLSYEKSGKEIACQADNFIKMAKHFEDQEAEERRSRRKKK